ncbi:hypothetical protein E2P81_ATG10202 [Venturia nashicola]|nr:hypothetical protein E2P81_ATG10202 [Venturia nashicola]
MIMLSMYSQMTSFWDKGGHSRANPHRLAFAFRVGARNSIPRHARTSLETPAIDDLYSQEKFPSYASAVVSRQI